MNRSRRLVDLIVLVAVVAVAVYFLQPTGDPLLGVWEGEVEGQSIRLDFRPDGTLHLRLDEEVEVATYTANLDPTPHQLDLEVKGQQVSTIFDFPEPNKLRLSDSSPGDARPTDFKTRKTLILTRAK